METKQRWRADLRGEYFSIANGPSFVYMTFDFYTSEDNKNYSEGNYFRTYEDAEKAMMTRELIKLNQDEQI